MDKIKQFEDERVERIKKQSTNKTLEKSSKDFLLETIKSGYSYNFSWMGRPIIQYPQDMIAMQEIIWDLKPDLIIETGIAHGGSIIFYASLLEMIGKGEVLGIDIDIRSHNKSEIENHSMYKRIEMFEGSSIDSKMIDRVKEVAKGKETVLVLLDSNHTHDHVLDELNMYAQFVTANSYLVCFDTVVEDLPNEIYENRPWSVGNNPKTAVHEFLKNNNDFVIDKSIDHKLLISVAPDGYLKRVK
ncbi:cephalosporin hydroxylase family protein [Saprospiraceae bacterium]|nr:cephalosporin hydroxylase family protein [Saprospiraceae bacterium]